MGTSDVLKVGLNEGTDLGHLVGSYGVYKYGNTDVSIVVISLGQ